MAAYETLGDEQQRKRFDAYGSTANDHQGGSFSGFEGFDWEWSPKNFDDINVDDIIQQFSSSFSFDDDDDSGFAELFKDFSFGSGSKNGFGGGA